LSSPDYRYRYIGAMSTTTLTSTSPTAKPSDPHPLEPNSDPLPNKIIPRLTRALTNTSTSPRNTIRKVDFGFLPIPKNRRHDPNLKPEEQFLFSWRMNLVFATAAVSLLSVQEDKELTHVDCIGHEPVLYPSMLYCLSPNDNLTDISGPQPMLVR